MNLTEISHANPRLFKTKFLSCIPRSSIYLVEAWLIICGLIVLFSALGSLNFIPRSLFYNSQIREKENVWFVTKNDNPWPMFGTDLNSICLSSVPEV